MHACVYIYTPFIFMTSIFKLIVVIFINFFSTQHSLSLIDIVTSQILDFFFFLLCFGGLFFWIFCWCQWWDFLGFVGVFFGFLWFSGFGFFFFLLVCCFICLGRGVSHFLWGQGQVSFFITLVCFTTKSSEINGGFASSLLQIILTQLTFLNCLFCSFIIFPYTLVLKILHLKHLSV